ncbi:protein FAM63B-like isoform X2 [Rhizophagus clarus]|uniref:Protein FAM63B-like isoform X2 n=1 Tax=Rhizophagus clarus TaxID=94130 RepID=A0A8H3LLE4_9GLOM|nr:protein FAM63B-like isoform X2 [Rhizophagus clarus]
MAIMQGKSRAVEEDTNAGRKSISTNKVAVEYQLKAIEWIEPSSGQVRKLKVITQNENGPCPLLALCNVLLLRGDIKITPYDRSSVTYDFLVELLGDYLLKSIPQGEAEIQNGFQATNGKSSQSQEEKKLQPYNVSNGVEDLTNKIQQTTLENGVIEDKEIKQETNGEIDIMRPSLQDYHHTLNAALSIIPSLQTGLDVNVHFNSIHGFEPTAELSVFDVFHVDLVHGWVVDPQDEETWNVVVGKCGSYNKAVECVVGGDSVSKGIVVESSNKASDNGFEDSKNSLNEDDNIRVRDALITSQFLDSTATQLTYHGLLSLSETLPPGHLCIFFRNNHFSTLYKHPETTVLYILVTDAGFVHEKSMVWESLIDVDQNASEFVNGQFKKGEVTGGDYVDVVEEHQNLTGGGDQDYALALSLQQEEEREAEYRRQKESERRQQESQRRRNQEETQRRKNHHKSTSQISTGSTITTSSERERKKDKCIIS